MNSGDAAPTGINVTEGREADAVIVFADIVGCSQISDAIGLREYARFIAEFHRTASTAAAAVFRAPEYEQPKDFELSIRGDEACLILHRSPREDVQRALTFAVMLQLLWVTTAYNRQRLAKGASPIEIGIGVHSGAVYIDRFQHAHPTSEGYSINVAKRIEGLTRKGATSKIMISSQAFAHLAAEDHGLSFITQPFKPTRIRGVRGEFVLRELLEIDELLILDLGLTTNLFDTKLLEQIAFVAKTREDAPWLRVLWRIAYGVAHGEESLFRFLFSQQIESTRNSGSWFLRAKREASSDPNMAAMMFELAASSAKNHGSLFNARDEKAWALYNAALTHECRGAFSASIECYHKALRLRPQHAQHQLGLVGGYLKAGRAKDALSFLYEVRDEFLDDQEHAAALFLESLCHECLSASQSAAACRAVLERRFTVKHDTAPPLDVVLRPGADAGDIVLKAFQGAKSQIH